MKKLDLSLILACFNEGKFFTSNVKKIFAVLDSTKLNYDIIFIDDKSSDQTRGNIKEIIKNNKNHNFKALFHHKNVGRGRTVSEGILLARGKIAGYIDVDLEIPADYIPRFVQAINSDCDIATAFRIYDFTFRSLPRWFGSKGYVILRKFFLKDNLKDTEAGYKFFNRQKIIPIVKKCQENGWFWDTEIMIRSLKAGLKICQIPTVFIRDFNKKSTVNFIPDSINYFKKLYLYKDILKITR